MNKQRFVITGCLGIFLFWVVISAALTENSSTVSINEPLPVRAPAPVYVPVQVTPSAAYKIESSSSQPMPEPQPVPVPPLVANAISTRTSGEQPSLPVLPFLLFVSTVVLSVGFVVLLCGQQVKNGRFSQQPTRIQGVPS